ASQARAQVERSGLLARPSIALAVAVSAYVNAYDGRRSEAIADLDAARALLVRLEDFGAWFEIETAAALAAAATSLNDPETARNLIGSARRRLGDLPDGPMLEAWIEAIEEGLMGLSADDLAELTPAELKVVRLLPSHLSYRQIAAELTVSPNTIKSQVRSAFGKLEVSSRHEAVELCRSLDLPVEQSGLHPPAAPPGEPHRPDNLPFAPSG
ncbi:MAG: response regulator transcription factor, partial [Solirubrobacterales bacterium]